MKRKSVVLDEDLLKEALAVSGERTYSAAVTKALRELVRAKRLEMTIQKMRETPDMFRPGYLEQIRPNSWAAVEKREAETGVRRSARGRGRSSR